MNNNVRSTFISKCFNPKVDDPVAFDLQRINHLARTYSPVLLGIRDWVERDDAFSDAQIRQFILCHLDWDNVALLLIGGCASAELLAINPIELTNFWRAFTKSRIIPGLIINKFMERTIQSYDPQDLVKACVVSIGAIWEVLEEVRSVGPDNVDWNIQACLNSRVARIVFMELCTRFNKELLEFPEQALAEYESDQSPLLRSSILETIILSLCTRSGIYLKNKGWIRSYEDMRQLLDDLIDVKHDLLNGRITYPVLLALASNNFGERVRSLIESVWSTSHERRLSDCSIGKQLLNLLVQSGALDQTAEKILDLSIKVRKSISKEKFPGSVAGLLCLIEVKRAALYRLKANDWVGRRPSYNLFRTNLS